MPDLDYRMPFYYDVLEVKLLTFTRDEPPFRIQIGLTFIYIFDQLKIALGLRRVLDAVGVATRHSTSIADLISTPAHFSVSVFTLETRNWYSFQVFFGSTIGRVNLRALEFMNPVLFTELSLGRD